MDKFIENLKTYVDAFEDVELSAQTEFTQLPQWDSLALLSTMAMIASEYGVNVSSQEIASCKNLSELEALVRSKS